MRKIFSYFQRRGKKDTDELNYWQLVKVLWRLLENHRVKYIFGTILFAVSAVLVYVQINMFGKALDALAKYQDIGNLNEFWYYMALQVLTQFLIQVFRTYSNNVLVKVRTEAAYDIKAVALKKLVNFPLVWHQKENSGNKVEKIQNGARNVQQFLASVSRDILPIFLDFVIILSIFSFTDWKFLVFFAVYTIVFFVIQIYFGRRFNIVEKLIAKLSEKVAGRLFESASNILTTKSNSSSKRITERVLNSEYEILQENHKVRNLEMSKSNLLTVVNTIGNIIFFLMVADNFVKGVITIGFVLVYNRYYFELRNSITRFGNSVDIWRNQKTNIARMMPIFDEQPEIYFDREEFPTDWSSIELQSIGFEYQQDEVKTEKQKSMNLDAQTDISKSSKQLKIPGLQNISMQIKRGEKIGLVGRSGSGKSTLAKILIGLYKISQGKITIGGKEFYSLNHGQITQNISIVLQDTELFNMTLLENITMLREVDEQTVTKAVQIAQLDEVVAKLPKGLDTKVGEKGYKLSGGERQRVGIARAICSGAEVLIFDEATSALDSQTEKKIQEAIDNLPNKTLILIAHRLSTLQNVDRIIVFEQGKIVEEGEFTDLKNNPNSKFGQLWQLQVQGVAL